METYLNILKVIEVVSTKGKGTNGDPVREVRDYFLSDGTSLCSFDPIRDNDKTATVLAMRSS
jgi:hypothetical protein